MTPGATKLFGVTWQGFLLAGVGFTLLALFGLFLDRNLTDDQRRKSHTSYGSEKVYWARFIGPPLVIIGLILMAINIA
jgi:hypothetical protein